MKLGITAGFGEPIRIWGDTVLADLKRLGWQVVRQDGQKADQVKLKDLAAEIIDAGLEPMFLCTAAQVGYIPEGVRDIEVLDVIDPTTSGSEPHFRVTPQDYANTLNRAAPIIKERGLRAWAGLVGSDSKSLVWTSTVFGILDPIFGLSIHRYPPSGAKKWDDSNWGGRGTEILNLRAVSRHRPFMVGEFGWHQGQQQNWWDKLFRRHWHLSDLEQAANIKSELNYWREVGAEIACVYQLNNGKLHCPQHPTLPTDWIGGFGIRRDDGTWKPSADQSIVVYENKPAAQRSESPKV